MHEVGKVNLRTVMYWVVITVLAAWMKSIIKQGVASNSTETIV